MKISELIGEARQHDNYNISYVTDPTKVTATVSDVISQKYTRLANNLKKIEALTEEIKKLQEDTKQQRREDVVELFDAEDVVMTRVIETRTVILTLSKDPKPTESPKYKVILEELEKHLTPELVTVLEALKREHKTTTQKEPSLRIDMKEGDGDQSQLLQKVYRWIDRFDQKLKQIKGML